MSDAVDKISQFNVKRTPNDNQRKQKKTKQIHPKSPMKCINKNVAEKIK
jgi:hypothetical protein